MGLYKHSKNTNKPVIRQILDLVPPWLFTSCTNAYKTDKGIRWKDANIHSKRILQEMVYPEGISYDRGTDKVRTFRVNTFFALIPELIRLLKGKEKGDLIKINQVPRVGSIRGLGSNSDASLIEQDFKRILAVANNPFL